MKLLYLNPTNLLLLLCELFTLQPKSFNEVEEYGFMIGN